MLDRNVGIESSTLLPSTNALVPLVVYLGTRPDAPLKPEEADALLYWLFGAFLFGRYNQSGDTRIAEDAKAVRGDKPLESLYGGLGLLGGRLEVTEQALVGKGAGSPYFLLSYLAAKKNDARDWWYGVGIGLDAQGGRSIEYHHIHPQATLKKRYAQAEINDLSNLAFISGRANRKISDRSPSKYFDEVGATDLARHFVPLDTDVRIADAYPEFITRRRRLLASAMTAFLDRFRPSFLLDTTPAVEPVASNLAIVAGRPGGVDSPLELELRAQAAEDHWVGRLILSDLLRMLSDVDDGLTGACLVGGEVVTVAGGADSVEIPIGPLLVTGSVAEWRAMIERELTVEAADHEWLATSPPWTGTRVPLSVLESE